VDGVKRDRSTDPVPTHELAIPW